MIGAGDSTMHGSSGGYTEWSASYCGSNLRSMSTHDKSPVDRYRRRYRHHPVLGIDRAECMVRVENGRVEGRLLKVTSEGQFDKRIDGRGRR